MTLQVSTKLEHVVEQLLASGRYRDENQLLSEALELLQQRDSLHRDIAAALDSLDRGEGIPADKVFAELDAQVARIETS